VYGEFEISVDETTMAYFKLLSHHC